MKRLIVALLAFCCLVIPATASAAYNPLGAACSAGTNQSSACTTDGSDPIGGNHGVLRKVSNIIALIAGVAAVIVIIIAGLQYITAGGDPQKASGARNAILGAVIGIIIIAAAQSILLFVLSRAR